MAPIIQNKPSKLFARNIAAYSDAELDQYLEDNGRSIKVDDPENLMKDEVLLQRLRARTCGAPSRPIDLDDLAARLEDVSANRDRQAQPRPPSQVGSEYRSRATTESIDDEEDYRRDLRRETKCYNTLVNEGGRPSHPVNLGRDILDNPGEYREILSFWQGRSNDWEVFRSQMGEWRVFRESQRYNREEGRFPKYVEAVKRGLARHGFTRPVQFDEDLERQVKLTTWIEFLDYEYWKQDKDMKFVKRLQPQYDEAWKELVDSQVLGPFDTEEFICNIKSAYQRASERERAEEAVESAKSAVMAAQKAVPDPRRARLFQQATQGRLAAAHSQLDAAIKSLESIRRRNDLVHEFFKKTQLDQVMDGKLKRSYQNIKDNAQRRSILLRWILQQIPLIELELDPGGEDSRKRLKRHPTEDLTPERVPKRRREDNGNNTLSTRRTRASTAPTTPEDFSSTKRPSQTARHEEQLKHNPNSTDKERPRHSAQTSKTAESVPRSIQWDRLEPDDTAAQVPPKARKRQPKLYKKERKSRRLAGHSPQFGMLPKRGEPAPPYTPPSRYPSIICKLNPPSPRSNSSFKKRSMTVKGAKAQGISKSRQEETTRSKRAKKRSGG